jgi:branched-chain amino acid transport system substrate-binding protein
MRRIPALLALCAALTLGCQESKSRDPIVATPTAEVPAEIVAPPGSSITIGVSAALSGDQAPLGTDLVDAAKIAVSLYGGAVKGHPVEIASGDDACSSALQAVSVADDFVARDQLIGVIGPMCSNGALAANQRYERAHIVHISPSVTRVDISALGDRFFFRTAWRDDAQAAVQSAYARRGMGASSAIVISDREPYGNALADAFTRRFEADEGNVIETLTLERGTVEMSGIAKQIVDADPDLVVFEGVNPEGALLVVALSEAGYQGGFIGPDGLLNARDFLLPAGDAARGAVITGGATPSVDYAAAFETLYGRPITTPFVLQAHDAVTALLKAVDASGTVDPDGTLRVNRERLAAVLREQRFAGLTGSVAFDEHGDRRGESATELGIAVYRVDFGVFATVQ